MLYEAEAGNLTLVAGGDTMITRRLSVFREPAFLSLVELFRSADVGYANLEMLMHDFEHSPGIAGCEFRSGNLDKITLHPIDMGHGKPRPQRGRPMLATGEISRLALDRVKRLCRPLGVDVDIEDGVGVIRP